MTEIGIEDKCLTILTDQRKCAHCGKPIQMALAIDINRVMQELITHKYLVIKK